MPKKKQHWYAKEDRFIIYNVNSDLEPIKVYLPKASEYTIIDR